MKCTQLTKSIFTVADFFTRQECLGNTGLSEKIGYGLAKVNTAAGSRVRTDARNNRALYEGEALAGALWPKAAPYVPARLGHGQATGPNELFRFYRYQRGHQFKGHCNESYSRNASEASYWPQVSLGPVPGPPPSVLIAASCGRCPGPLNSKRLVSGWKLVDDRGGDFLWPLVEIQNQQRQQR